MYVASSVHFSFINFVSSLIKSPPKTLAKNKGIISAAYKIQLRDVRCISLLTLNKVANLVVPAGVEEMQGSTYMCRFLRFEHC
jgi:hypothetical protein